MPIRLHPCAARMPLMCAAESRPSLTKLGLIWAAFCRPEQLHSGSHKGNNPRSNDENTKTWINRELSFIFPSEFSVSPTFSRASFLPGALVHDRFAFWVLSHGRSFSRVLPRGKTKRGNGKINGKIVKIRPSCPSCVSQVSLFFSLRVSQKAPFRRCSGRHCAVGMSLPDSVDGGPNRAKRWRTSGKPCPNLGKAQPNSAELSPHRAKHGPNRAGLGQLWPMLAQTRPKSAVGPTAAPRAQRSRTSW